MATATLNSDKTPPKTEIKFSVTLSEEQKQAKAKIISTPFNLYHPCNVPLLSKLKFSQYN